MGRKASSDIDLAKIAFEANFKSKASYLIKSVADLKGNELPKADLVIGGFPCQDFSLAGKRKGFTADRGRLYQEMARIIREVKPKAFVAENVYGLLSIDGAVETIKKDLQLLSEQTKAFGEIYLKKELIKPKEIYIKLNSDKSQLSLARKNNTHILTYYFHKHHYDYDATITIESAGAGGLFILSDILEKKFLLSEEYIDKIIDEISS